MKCSVKKGDVPMHPLLFSSKRPLLSSEGAAGFHDP